MKIKVLLIPLVLFLFSCSMQTTDRSKDVRVWLEPNGKLKVLSTTAMISDLVETVGGDQVDVLTLIYGNLDPHSYEIVKGDDELIACADVVFYNGLGLEHGPGLRMLLENHPHSISLGDHLQKEYPQLVLYEEGQIDPHAWLDISLWEKNLPVIEKELIVERPLSSESISKASQTLSQEMIKEHCNVIQRMSSYPSKKRHLVTSHDAFNYFTRAYLATDKERKEDTWRYRVVAPEGLSPEATLSVSDIQFVINYIDKYNVNTIFPESNVSLTSIKKILDVAKEKGIPLNISKDALYGDAMGSKNSEGDTYLGMIRHNSKVISKYWE